ncbi:MAG: hypothetical protein NT159_19805 [Proteobacteria bacterium]|nr:hypothetical protein [Pseudomonadota bacterium]
MIRTMFLICFLFLMPIGLVAAEHPPTNADLSAYKELTQARADALKESMQKEIWAQTVRVDAQDKRIDRQDKLLDSFSARISDLSIFLTVAGLVIGLLGYFTVTGRAKVEARQAAAEWIETEGQKALDRKLKELDSHIDSQKVAATAKRKKFDDDIDELRANAGEALAKSQQQLDASLKVLGRSDYEEALQTKNDSISKLVEALKFTPEAEYGFEDWNARAFDALTKGNLTFAAEYWLQAARSGNARGVAVANSLVNAGIALSHINRWDEVMAVSDEVVSRFGSALDEGLRVRVAMASLNKGNALLRLQRKEEAIAAYGEVVSRFGSAPDERLRVYVAMALANKGTALSQMNRREEAIAVSDEMLSCFGSAPEEEVRVQVATALVSKGNNLNQLKRETEAIAAYGDVVSRYGSAPEGKLRVQVATALANKGITLGELKRSEEAIAVSDEVVSRFGGAPEDALRAQVAIALNSKGAALLIRAKANWCDEPRRLEDLQAAAPLFARAETEKSDKSVVWGNQAYTYFLLGQAETARPLLKRALQQGGETFHKSALGFRDIYPIPPDTAFAELLEETWAEVKRKA